MSIQESFTIPDDWPAVENDEWPPEKEKPRDRSFAAFERKMLKVIEANKRSAEVQKRKKKVERIRKQQMWCRQMKRTQRYLGLRPRKSEIPPLESASLSTRRRCDVAQAAPYPFDYSVVFICIDVEAYEQDNDIITEIGVSTLDTLDLLSLPPGEGGSAWMKQIRCRHFRVQEYANLCNQKYVRGCPDKFDFGESEWISRKDALDVLMECFHYPFSAPVGMEEGVTQEEGDQPRRFVLVGHSIESDLAYLRKLGFNPRTLPSFLEMVDTGVLWRALKREHVHRTLEITLYQLGLVGWHLHNAGNDAAYTMQAMIALALRDLEPRDAIREEREARIQAAIKEGEERAREEGDGWSTTEEGDDGGFVEIKWIPQEGAPNWGGAYDPGKKETVKAIPPHQRSPQARPLQENRSLPMRGKPLPDIRADPTRNFGSQNRHSHKHSQSSVSSTVKSTESGSERGRGRGRAHGDQHRGDRGRGWGRGRGHEQGRARGRGVSHASDRSYMDTRSGLPADGRQWPPLPEGRSWW